jgi:hypothetical protein
MAARTSPAALRNREPIAAALASALPKTGQILMIAEGSGEHAAYFARCFDMLRWLPSDPDAEARASIAAHREEAKLDNLLAPIALDASDNVWPVDAADAVICINMIHISPWSATTGLMAGAARCLPQNGLLYLYGPYFEAELEPAPSNIAFDKDLRSRNPEWGLRDLREVIQLASAHDLALETRTEMPANNLSLCFRRV